MISHHGRALFLLALLLASRLHAQDRATIEREHGRMLERTYPTAPWKALADCDVPDPAYRQAMLDAERAGLPGGIIHMCVALRAMKRADVGTLRGVLPLLKADMATFEPTKSLMPDQRSAVRIAKNIEIHLDREAKRPGSLAQTAKIIADKVAEPEKTKPAASAAVPATPAAAPTGAAAPVVSTAARELHARLDALERRGDLNAVMTLASNPKTQEELGAALDWLKPRAFTSKGGSRLIYTYAHNLWVAQVKESAAAMLLYAMLTVRVDAARAADPTTTAPSKIRQLDAQFVSIRDHFRQLDPAAKERLVQTALAFEQRNLAREKDAWLCGGGMSFFEKFERKHGHLKGQVVDDPSVVGGKRTVLDDPTILPDFVSDEAWAVQRQAIRADFQRRMLE